MNRSLLGLALALAFVACDNPAAPADDQQPSGNTQPNGNQPGGDNNPSNQPGGNNPGGEYVPAGSTVFDPALPATTFQSVKTDTAAVNRIAGAMWAAFSAPQCWDASFIGPSTPDGTYAGSVSQYSFSGQGQYRYVGFSDTYFGTVGLSDVGTYKGRPAVLMSTWSGDTEGFILVDNNRFEHVMATPDGSSYFAVTFWTSNGPCL